MGIHHIVNKADYQKQMQKAASKLVVIKFFATWCGHCKMIAPVIDKLCNEGKTDVVFLEVDIDENGDIARGEYIVGVPTFVLYRNRERLGVTTNDTQLKEMISQHK